MKRIFFLIILFNVFYNYQAFSLESYVVLKVNNKIITNIDINNEYRYLIALSPDLQKVDKKKVINLAKDSIIREKIKEEEIIKHFDLTVKNKFIDKIFTNFYKKRGMSSKNEFKNYLSKYNLDIKEIEKKITIEVAWNDLIYKKFGNRLKIDELKIKNKIKNILSNNKKQNIYLISEILFSVENYNDLQKKYKLIEKNILEIGFSNSANIHSISDTAKLGGKIGWVYESRLNEIVKKEMLKLNIGEYTKPITMPGGFLIIKLEDKKMKKIDFNLDEEFNKRITKEKNSQLSQFSEIYFKKIKKNSTISEK